MSTNQKKYYDIVGGPNRDVLFDACKYAYAENIDFSVSFTVATVYTMPKDDPRSAYMAMETKDFKICGIEHEDGSGENFNLRGYCQAKLDSSDISDNEYCSYKFNAYYNVKNRSGKITFY